MAILNNFTDKQMGLMSGSNSTPSSYYPTQFPGHFVEFNVYDKDDKYITTFSSLENDFPVTTSPRVPSIIENEELFHSNEVDGIHYQILINPTDALNRVEELKAQIIPSGKYTLEINFYRAFDSIPYNSQSDIYTPQLFHIVDEISNSRKELRCAIRNITNTEFIPAEMNNYLRTLGSLDETSCIIQTQWDSFTTQEKLNNLAAAQWKCYNFNWVLKSEHYPGETFTIINWEIDTLTDPQLPTVVFRFDKALPGLIKRLDEVQIVEEVYPSQTDNILFIKQDVLTTNLTSLRPDYTMKPTVSGDTSTYQSYNDLSSSFMNGNLIDQVVSGSHDNLNIDYNEFSNHAFFGSAAIKLENFKRKIGNLQGHWNELSQSLANSGSVESHKLIREKAFKGINEIVNTFTPYEKFLYEDYQSETTASAPGLGKNLVSQEPLINTNDDAVVANNYNIFDNYENLPTVHKVQGEGNERLPVHLFTHKYNSEDPPFFNSTGSFYLSFWAKSDEEFSGSHQIITAKSQDIYGVTDFDGLSSTIQLYSGYEEGSISPPAKYNLPYHGQANFMTGSWKSVNNVSASITGSTWRFIVIHGQNYYWRPRNNEQVQGDTENISDWTDNVDGYEILSSSVVNQAFYEDGVAYGVSDSTGKYGYLLSPTSMSANGDIINTDIPRSGSFLPAGQLFGNTFYVPDRLPGSSGNLNTSQSMWFTDIKITKNNPLDALPFASIYATGSSQFDTWFSNISSSAVVYDESNINSFKNNLPKYFKESNSSEELRKFLDLWGEHFDSIKNYIDNYTSFYNRSYSKTNSVPDNLLPILSENLGWELIQPFSSSLSNVFEEYAAIGGDSEQEIIYSTWRKTLNNLIYLYKTKGTKNSLNALLNTYGYPSHYVSLLNEYGGNEDTETLNTLSAQLDNEINVSNPGRNKSAKLQLHNESGSVTYQQSIGHLKGIVLTNTASSDLDGGYERRIELDRGDAHGTQVPPVDCIEFVFKTQGYDNKQEILVSTGSNGLIAMKPWVLEMNSGSMTFRVTDHGSTYNTDSSNISMSVNLTGSQNQLWNVMLTRDTNIASYALGDTYPQTYELYVANQDGDSIPQFHYTSMSISSSHANTAWEAPFNRADASLVGGIYTGLNNAESHGVYGQYSSGSNLWVGPSLTGSISQLRGWSNKLSSSVFKKHVLNKFDYTGNTINSWKNELIWYYKLDEDPGLIAGGPAFTIKNSSTYATRSVSIAGFGRTDFDRPVSASLGKYTTTPVAVYTLGARGSSTIGTKNDKNVIIADKVIYTDKLNPTTRSTLPYLDDRLNRKKPSQKLSFVRSPLDAIDNYLSNIMSDKSVYNQIKPSDMFESRYATLDTLHKEAIPDQGVKTDVPKFIKANKKIFGESVISSIKKVVPGRAQFTKIGIEFRSDLLTRPKYKYHKPSVEDASGQSGSIDMISYIPLEGEYVNTYSAGISDIVPDLTPSYFELYTGTLFDKTSDLFGLSSSYLNTKDSSIDLSQNISTTYQATKNTELNLLPPVAGEQIKEYTKNISTLPTLSQTYDSPKEYTISDFLSFGASFDQTRNTVIDIDIPTLGEYNKTYNDSIDLLTPISSEYNKTHTDNINIITPVSSEYNKTRDTSISLLQDISTEYGSTKDVSLNLLQNISTEYNSTNNVSINLLPPTVGEHLSTKNVGITTLPTLTQNYTSMYEDTIDFEVSELSGSLINMISSFINVYSDTVDGGSKMDGVKPGTSAAKEAYTTGELLELRDRHTRSWESINPDKKWGRTYSDTHYIYDWAEVNLNTNPITGSDAFGNVWYREPRWTFYDVGQRTWVSGSILAGGIHWDCSDYTKFKNLDIVDSGKGYTYESFYGENGDWTEDGRPVGQTSYFSQSNLPYSGNIHYPVNHINNFGPSGFRYKYSGTQLTGYWNTWHPNDFSTASFYTVEVAQSRRTRVDNTGNPGANL